jgi:hypothetical protein
LMGMMFFALVLPNPAEGGPSATWDAPFTPVGKIVLTHLNTIDSSLSFCSFSGFDLCIAALAVIALLRKSSGSKIDSRGRIPTPVPLVRLAWLSLATTAFEMLLGLVTGGNIAGALWQLNAVMYTPLVFLLFHVGLRGPEDHRAIAKVVLTAAVYKSLLAIYVVTNIHGPVDPYTGSDRLAFATSHADSILFADAFLIVVALLLEGAKIKRWALVLLPLFAAAMVANNRRLVWVQVILVLLTAYIVSKDSPRKRTVRRSLMFIAPVAGLYVLAGWNSGGGSTFRPVRMLRSVVDAKSDGSSFWRELENYNLITTLRENLIFGSGYGHGYTEFVAMPPVGYPLEHYIPHNGILGLWAFGGYLGYAGLTMLWAGGVYFAMRSFHGCQSGSDRAAALVSFGSVLVWLMMCWGDLGVGLWAGIFTVAPAFAVAGKLAVASGEWFSKESSPRRQARPYARPSQTSER